MTWNWAIWIIIRIKALVRSKLELSPFSADYVYLPQPEC
jgi:hypothetical protein